MTRNYKALTSFWFLAGLSLLLLNDLVLKQMLHNRVTGKLSDFAGLFIFPIFWTVIFPKRKQTIFILTAFVFVFWKSDLSESLLGIWNDFSFFTLQRTIDYSDCLALLILPIAYKFDRPWFDIKPVKLNPIIPIVLSSFAFMATSYKTETNVNKTYHFDFGKDTLINRFNKLKDLNYGNGVPLSNTNPDTINLNVPSDFCFKNFMATIEVLENDKGGIDITLISTEHKCPSNKDGKEKMTKEFEIKIIDRLKNGL